jgi:hypothetical protein
MSRDCSIQPIFGTFLCNSASSARLDAALATDVRPETSMITLRSVSVRHKHDAWHRACSWRKCFLDISMG